LVHAIENRHLRHNMLLLQPHTQHALNGEAV